MFARQLLARVALRVAEELQRPPRRPDQPGSATQAAESQRLYNSNHISKDSAEPPPFWFSVPAPLLLLGELAKQSRSGGQV